MCHEKCDVCAVLHGKLVIYPHEQRAERHGRILLTGIDYRIVHECVTDQI